MNVDLNKSSATTVASASKTTAVDARAVYVFAGIWMIPGTVAAAIAAGLVIRALTGGAL
jgi:hypothetical protein